VSAALIACRECDRVQREVDLPLDGIARCSRCGSTLYSSRLGGAQYTLALTAGAIVLFIIANAFPIVGLQMQGQVIETTLFETVRVLSGERARAVAALVFVTALAMPALELLALTYLLLPLWLTERTPPYFAYVLRALQLVQPWNMLDIFMLGVLVSVVKLADTASIIIGTALWALAALMLLMAEISATLDTRALWARVAPRQ
jgi:paraquat-inducible protein A